MAGNKKSMRCAFCGKSQDQVERMLVGPNVYICNECVELCMEILMDEIAENARAGGEKETSATNLPKPAEIYEKLSEYVIGQDDAKKTLAVAVYNHYKRINSKVEDGDDCELAKSNIVMMNI